MKKLFSFLMVALLTLSLMPMILADGDDATGDVDVEIEGSAPEVFSDVTERSWNPNDQTFYTADAYGTLGTNAYGDDFYNVPFRGDYVFTGETIDYYVIVWDENGENNIDNVVLMRNLDPVGACGEIDPIAAGFWADGDALPQFNIDPVSSGDPDAYEDSTMDFFRCHLIVQSPWNGEQEFFVRAIDDDGNMGDSAWTDTLTANPPLSVNLAGSISFGSAVAGETVTSNSVNLQNVGSNGVVMDMYIASDDFFTDPTNPFAICGIGNGIPFTAFSYYATKGSIDSGDNDNVFFGLGETAGCVATTDEYTPMPSYSGDIFDMCRIINHLEQGSFLTQGQSMSMTFQLDVPSPCVGSFSEGQFHFSGRAV